MSTREEMALRTLSWAIVAVIANAEKAAMDIETVIETIRSQANKGPH
jgi:hypothetical protein